MFNSLRALCALVLFAAGAFGQQIIGGSSGGGGGGTTAYTTVSFSSTPTFTVTASTSIQDFQITLTGNVTSSTLSLASATSGQDIGFKICQDATGGRSFVWPANVINPGILLTTASVCNKQIFRYDGTNAVAFGVMTDDSATPGIVTPTGTLLLPTGNDTLAGLAANNAFTGTNSFLQGIALGSSPPALTAGTGGAQAPGEGTAPSVGPASGVDVCYADSSLHGTLCNNNNAGYLPIVLGPASVTPNNILTWTSEGKAGAGFAPGANVATFLATPSGANFNAMIAAGGIPINCSGTCVKSAAYTTVLGDGGGTIIHSSADNNARTFTIDSNANVAFPLYTTITFINLVNTVTIAITSDTLTLAGSASTGSRTLAVNGMATAVKIGTTSWLITGPGLT